MTGGLVPEGGAPAVKGYTDGSHRLVPPAETVDRVRRLMPALGITRIANVTGLDTIGIPVTVVCRPNSRSLSVSQGKGLSLDAARASGLMESVELFHAERITRPLKLARYNDLRFTHSVVEPERLPRISVSTFHPGRRLLWIEGLDLLTAGSLWVPFEMVHMDLTLPLPQGSGCFPMGSNGLASGNHPFEAMIQAVCEVVERDSTAIWFAREEAERDRTRLDLDTIDDPGCIRALEHYERAEVGVAVWETTSDVGVPAYYCTIIDRQPDPTRPLYPAGGMGCHPSRRVALHRALVEAAQSRLTMISSSRDDLPRADYELNQSPELLERMRARVVADDGRHRFDAAPDHSSDTFDDDLLWLLGRLEAAGIKQVIGVDLSLPGLGLPVVRAIIPGLESTHLTPGWVPGPRIPRTSSAPSRQATTPAWPEERRP